MRVRARSRLKFRKKFRRKVRCVAEGATRRRRMVRFVRKAIRTGNRLPCHASRQDAGVSGFHHCQQRERIHLLETRLCSPFLFLVALSRAEKYSGGNQPGLLVRGKEKQKSRIEEIIDLGKSSTELALQLYKMPYEPGNPSTAGSR